MSECNWKKSSRSTQGGQCVQTAGVRGAALIRDSKLGECSPVLSLSTAAFGRFVGAIKSGRFQ
ncbi:DUF397 domain-containing protein [Saccharopolyspora sp. NFXS83]|uniref:DUF397 domain-containing protein n=1 Tax=Saccharopolyspora sp. NFXS83 TaxID=2993560 RepID=UPI00224A721D|nr:DUF397 domain-containing protein [Saccharopolyspora sp. NFXS83]MCX2730749.1 DUF397 domain-containing protein [Saccharopolyspora sp. NFXS83]